jgi:hypothetical protein
MNSLPIPNHPRLPRLLKHPIKHLTPRNLLPLLLPLDRNLKHHLYRRFSMNAGFDVFREKVGGRLTDCVD